LRKGAFWEDRYYATAVQTGEHLARCFLYDDNISRLRIMRETGRHAGLHLREWRWVS
jgi:putative transposase